MWWLIPIGIGIAAAIINALDDDAGCEKQHWGQKYQDVQRDIEWHRKDIEGHIHSAQAFCDFRVLTDLHFSSMKVANEAYKLLSSAQTAVTAISKALLSAKDQIAKLTETQKFATTVQERQTMSAEIESLRKLRKALFEDKDAHIAQKNNFLSEVKRFNNQTRLLKEAIRNQTGSRGVEWYQKSEARKALKRVAIT